MKKLYTASLMALATLIGSGSPLFTPQKITPVLGKSQVTPVAVTSAERHAIATQALMTRQALAGQKETPSQTIGMKAPARSQKLRQRLDKVHATRHSDGEEVSLQTFTFDDLYRPVYRCNQLPDGNNSWMTVEEHGYEWYDDSYCKSMWIVSEAYNYGERREFTYNDSHLGDTQSIYTYMDGKWNKFQRGEYVYDDKGRIIEEVLYGTDATGENWVPALKNTVTFNDMGLQTSYQSLTWDGSEWTALEDRMFYDYNERGQQTLWSFERYDNETGKWVNYYRIEQDFDNNGLITRQEAKFWNKSLQNWSGCEDWGYGICNNYRTDFFYDEQNRQKSEKTYMGRSTDTYTLSCVMNHTYTPVEGGLTEQYVVTTMYDENGENPEEEGHLTRRRDSRGNEVWVHEEKLRQGNWTKLYDESYEYDERNNLTKSRYWKYDESDGRRLADIGEDNKFDAFNNIVESTYCAGQGSDENDWVNTTHFTYKFECDTVRVEKLSYFWDGSNFRPNWGEGADFDFSIPIADIIHWPGVFYHKVLRTKDFMGSDTDWDWNEFNYEYSDIIEDGIDNIRVINDIRLRSNIVTDQLEFEGEKDPSSVTVYNLRGMAVVRGSGMSVDVSTLPSGIYIVDADGFHSRFVKR